jgi:predicted small secreted protein
MMMMIIIIIIVVVVVSFVTDHCAIKARGLVDDN